MDTSIDVDLLLAQRIATTGVSSNAISSSNQGKIYFDQPSGKYKVSENGASYTNLVGGGVIPGDLPLSGVISGSTATLVPNFPVNWYYGTVSSNLTISPASTPSAGNGFGIRIHVTSPFTLTFPSSYRIGGSSNPVTTLSVTPEGDYEISWIYSGGQYWMIDPL